MIFIKSKKKKSKYNNKITICPETGTKFHSAGEYRRWKTLQILERAGEIQDLITQEPFVILESFKSEGKTERGIKYIADFVYFDNVINKMVIEDFKSSITARDAAYIMKRKLIKSKYSQYIFRETF
tara:strand:+ start:333 stop:710 length:378 start_codon:yes stop_codon:yes gene_type:complete